MLGLFLFGERIHTGALDLAFEALALAIIIAGVSALSHSHLIASQNTPPVQHEGAGNRSLQADSRQ